MNNPAAILLVVVVMGTLAGCYIHEQGNGSLTYQDNITVSDSSFRMNGSIGISGTMEQEVYENISAEFYAEDGILIHRETLGTIESKSDRLTVRISLDTVPQYIVFDSPDIWDGETEIVYYVRSEHAANGYRLERTTDRSELPIEPDG